MTRESIAALCASLALAACADTGAPMPAASTNPAVQELITPGVGSLYAFSSPKGGTCPNLGWHVTVRDGSTLSGVITWDNERRMARVNGKLDQNREFTMTATEITGRGKAIIIGRVLADGRLSARISGAGCKSRLIEVPLIRPMIGGGG